MDFELIAIALGDVAWIALAFVLGLLSRAVGLPPMVGFLATGFALNLYGIASGEMLRTLSDLGITLLLFTVGLKLNLQTFARPQVWAVAGLHMAIAVAVLAVGIQLLALAGTPWVAGVGLSESLLIAFALSFSSTVFVVKTLEEKGAMASLAGRIAVGVLIVQDFAAVVFLAASADAWPSPWALLLFLLIPARPLLALILDRVGHGELLVLYSLLLALGGAELFELVDLKGDLGALVLGILVARHHKADEVAKIMFGFKNLFLLGFFLSIGLSGPLTMEAIFVGVAVTPLALLKSGLFFGLFTRFGLRARTSARASLTLANYSEFGLIIAALGVANGWLDSHWLIVLATALSLSCAVAAVLNANAHRILQRRFATWTRFEGPESLAGERPLDMEGAKIAILGMGRIGTAAYDHMHRLHGSGVVGVDFDPDKVRRHLSEGRRVLLGDPCDGDFWERVRSARTLDVVMLALPNHAAKLAALDRLSSSAFEGRIAAAVRFPDEMAAVHEAGASIPFNLYAEAGSGFARHVAAQMSEPTRSVVS